MWANIGGGGLLTMIAMCCSLAIRLSKLDIELTSL